MSFIASLGLALLCVAGIVVLLIFVSSFILMANSLDKIATAFVKWVERK